MRCWRYLRGPGNVIHALLDYCILYSLYIFYIILHFIFECACIVRYPAVTIRHIGVSGSCRISGIRPDIRFLLSGIIRYPTIRQIYYPVLSGIRLSGKFTIRPNPIKNAKFRQNQTRYIFFIDKFVLHLRTSK